MRLTERPDLAAEQKSELESWGESMAKAVEASDSQSASGPAQPLLDLAQLRYQRRVIERKVTEAVRQARQMGDSWHKIGNALGTTSEAARKRYKQLA